jgi:hypothetical protein
VVLYSNVLRNQLEANNSLKTVWFIAFWLVSAAAQRPQSYSQHTAQQIQYWKCYPTRHNHRVWNPAIFTQIE